MEEPALGRLERLAFVPAGTCILLQETLRVDCSTDRPLLVDRFEVTRREWSAWLGEEGIPGDGRVALEYWPDDAPTHPATGMTLEEARAFAASQGMRLPTAAEWIRVAVGTRAQKWPWGPFPARSVTNTLALRLRRLAPVGSFEGGRTSLGVYDLLGNAAEWVDGVLGRPDEWVENVIPDPDPQKKDLRVWAIGGSYLSHKRPTYTTEKGDTPRVVFNAALLDPRTRASDVGFRVVEDAEAWLRAHLASLPEDVATRARLVAIGGRWGRPALPLLRRHAAEAEAPAALADLVAGAEQ